MNDVSGSDDQPATKSDLRALRASTEARFDAHDLRFDAIEGNLRRLNIGFARMEGDMTEMKGKVDILLGMKEEFSQFKSSIDRMTKPIAKLESRPS